jgi:hypothetical protein
MILTLAMIVLFVLLAIGTPVGFAMAGSGVLGLYLVGGMPMLSGILQTEIVPFGDSLRSLSRRTQVADEQLIKLNRLVSPTELYVGVSMIVPLQSGQSELTSRTSAGIGESLLELAVKQGSDPWTLTHLNKLDGTWSVVPGDILYSPTGNGGNATGLPSAFINASIDPLPMVQGKTEVILHGPKDWQRRRLATAAYPARQLARSASTGARGASTSR